MTERTSTVDVTFDGKELSVVRLADGAPLGVITLPDAEAVSAAVAVLTGQVRTATASSRKRTTRKTSESESV